MSTENSCEQSIYSSIQTSTQASTPGSDTPSASENMSTTPTANLQMASPTYENMFRSFQDTFASLRVEMTRLEIENKRLVEHNTVIEKELETLNEENVKLSGANNDAMKKLAEVEDKNAGLQKEYSGLEGLKEVLGWKKRCEELDNRATENQKRIEKRFEELENRATENHGIMKKRMAIVQQQSQLNREQAIDGIKAQQALDLKRVIALMSRKDLKDSYIFREKPLETIPNGMIQVNRAKVDIINHRVRDASPPREDEDSWFLYVVRDQYKDFKKFANLAESVFGLDRGCLRWLKGTYTRFCGCDQRQSKSRVSRKEFITMWEEQASQKDRIYILSGEGDYGSSTVYFVEEEAV
ncbi:hypothetical protein FPQ18DRAFT_335959 [Pyronema domesticum]|uniref:Uncharacterized protein n=1 Tax=Pyronema omphalodes (strain CBS 100304) TaxID=1076935 RepID=U4LVH8_PYROM|nr:hypothetical protein FPQ18DRAFT_335959 [Pyronema domesticum]CCX34582.1 Protein of unknown function [Pyronema omphalodes CBS 100304]